VAEEYNIDIPPVFLTNAKLVPASQLAIRMPNALVEVMFSLRHYAIVDNKKGNSNRPNRSGGKQDCNTFTATVEQIKVLESCLDTKKIAARKMTVLLTDEEKEARKEKRKVREDDEEDERPSKINHSEVDQTVDG
jgi:hypothetical protein